MALDEKSKNRIVHLGAILFLIFAIIIFINVIFIAFEIDVVDLFSDKAEVKVTVMNNFDDPLFVECVCYGNIGKDNPSIKVYKERIEPGENHVFIHEYDKTNMVTKIGVAVYTSFNYGSDERTTDASYDFSNDEVYDLLAVISESGDTVTIAKLP